MTIKTIFVNQNTPDTSYFTVGSKPYTSHKLLTPFFVPVFTLKQPRTCLSFRYHSTKQ